MVKESCKIKYEWVGRDTSLELQGQIRVCRNGHELGSCSYTCDMYEGLLALIMKGYQLASVCISQLHRPISHLVLLMHPLKMSYAIGSVSHVLGMVRKQYPASA